MPKTKAVDVIRKSFVADPETNLDGADIRGVLDDLLYRQQPELMRIPDAVAKKYDRSHLTIEDLIRCRQVFFECGRGCRNLEGGSGLIDLAQRAVDPVRGTVTGIFVGIERRIVSHA